MSGSIQYCPFVTGLWHLALCLQESYVAYVRISFLLRLNNTPYIHHAVFARSPLHGHLGCSHLEVIVSDAAMNTVAQIPLHGPAFNDFEAIPSDSLLKKKIKFY